MSARIDLHTHSTASDGTTSPAQLVLAAAAAGLDVVALTDHDTTAGWTEAAEALPAGLRLIRGAELSCTYNGISLHLLAYLFDPEDAPLRTAMHALCDSRINRAQRMVELLVADRVPVTWDQVRELAGGAVGRPHIALALLESGLIGAVEDAFTPDWIGSSGRYWADKLDLDVLEAIALVQAAGGVTVFAHPAATARGRTVGDEVIVAMAAAGLAGLEVEHPDHDAPARARLRDLAAGLGLLTTGSSDFHGAVKQVQMGDNLTEVVAYEELTARATGLEVLRA